MRINYTMLYKWECLPDGTKAKFDGRLEALQWELSLRTKLGCVDIIMPAYLPEEMYDEAKQKEYNNAKKEYKRRHEKLEELLEVIKTHVSFDKKVDDEYLYELWISRIFRLNWGDSESDPVKDMEVLMEELSSDCDINPFEIELQKTNTKVKRKKGILTNIKSMFKK